MYKYSTILLFLFLGHNAFSQFSTVKRALDNINEGDFYKAKELLVKGMEKDSLNPGLSYAFSLLYNTPQFPELNPDSSYYFILEARKIFLSLDEKELDRSLRNGIDSAVLENQKLRLDSLAFNRVRETNSIYAYKEFQKKYPTATQINQSIQLEQKKAYQEAEIVDTYQAYGEFIKDYPLAEQYREALEKYEIRLFNTTTESGKLINYLDFLELRPESPYRPLAEMQILKISTVGNRIRDFRQFLSYAKDRKVRKLATDLIYGILQSGNNLDLMEKQWWSDSLRKVSETSYSNLYPMIDIQGFFFINQSGKIVGNKPFLSLTADALCGPSKGDLIVGRNDEEMLISDVFGNVLIEGNYDKVVDLGFGLLKITQNGNTALFLKSGEQISPFIYDDIQQIGGEYVAIQRNDKWGLISFLGLPVLPIQYDSIRAINGSILIFNQNKIAVSNNSALRSAGDRVNPPLVFIYDEYEYWPLNKLWVRSGGKEGLINSNSAFDLPLTEQEIVPDKIGYLIFGDNNVLLDHDFKEIVQDFSSIKSSNSFLHVIQNGQEFLITRDQLTKFPADSISLWGNNFATLKSGNEFNLVFKNLKRISLPKEAQLSLVQDDSLEYFSVRTKVGTIFYDVFGNELVVGEYTSIKALGNEYIVVEKKNKQGLFSSAGKELLPPKFDAFGGYETGGISILQNGKLGYYHLNDSIWIQPAFDRKLIRADAFHFIASENNRNFIIDREGKPLSEKTFDMISPWNDSTVLTRQDGLYGIYNPSSDRFVMDKFTEIKMRDKNPLGNIIRGPKGLGLIDPAKGIIIEPAFTFIEEFGDLIRAEKYFREADYYLVAYYTRAGKLIYRTGMDPEHYNLLLCDN